MEINTRIGPGTEGHQYVNGQWVKCIRRVEVMGNPQPNFTNFYTISLSWLCEIINYWAKTFSWLFIFRFISYIEVDLPHCNYWDARLLILPAVQYKVQENNTDCKRLPHLTACIYFPSSQLCSLSEHNQRSAIKVESNQE